MKDLNLYQKLSIISQEIGILVKSGENTFHKYKYITEPGVLEKIKPLLIQHGVFVTKSVVDVQTQVISTGKSPSVLTSVSIKYTFINVDNPQDRFEATFHGQGADSQDKGVYKAMTGCNKYAFLKTFDVATGDDPEGDKGVDENTRNDFI